MVNIAVMGKKYSKEAFNELLRRRGITLGELAKEVGVSATAMSYRVRRGRLMISHLEVLGRMLGVGWGYLCVELEGIGKERDFKRNMEEDFERGL